MGVVFAARHLSLPQRVAIKYLRHELMLDVKQRVRFHREARAAGCLTSEHAVRVFDVGTLRDGAPYIVMEYLEGCSLRAVLAKGGPLPVGLAVDYVSQAIDAIAEAHASGIVHRDVNPQNLFLARRGMRHSIKVLDFGISKWLAGEIGGRLTQTDVSMGTPEYTAPEQWDNARDVDGRADVWSLGAVLYQLLTGHAPFEGATSGEIYWRVMTQAAPRPRALRRDLPSGLEAVVLRCLEADPSARFQSVLDLSRKLAPFSQAGRAAHDTTLASARSRSQQTTTSGRTTTPYAAPSEERTTSGSARSTLRVG
jgi:serine/threonine-protein kinase